MKRLKIILSGILLVVFLSGATVGIIFWNFASQPAGTNDKDIIVEVESGMGLNQVAQKLQKQHIISNANTFRLYTLLKGEEGHIQAGEYKLSPSLKPFEILDRLTQGQTLLHEVTIPEGYRILEIARLFENAGLVDAENFIEATKNSAHLIEMDIPSGSLEGYLYPDTYRFSKGTGEEKIVATLLDTFKEKVLKDKYLKRAKEINMSLHEIVTLASLIEKETGRPQERKLISAVFHNRLKKSMRLQTDPTVIYALADFDGNIRKKDLSVDSPYNTYKYAGLPPGPIASPGLDAIESALYPDDTNMLFFVSRQDGSHQFSTNLDDHNRAVHKYQIKPAKG